MFRFLRRFFYTRAANSGRHHALYIVPTLDGLKVVALNITLLAIGLVYANNYVLLFNFILFCLFLGSMFYTHFNLSGIKLDSVQFPSFHANEDNSAILHFSSTNAQGHYFVRPFFKSTLVRLNHFQETFQIKANEVTTVKMSIKGIKRGQEIINAIYIETVFPFNFFRCFTFFNINQEMVVYPERSNLAIHEEIEVTDPKKDEGEDFFLRDYILGDSLKRVDWKKMAQTNKWYVRQFEAHIASPVMLVLDKTPVEETLKSISFAIHDLHQQNIKYGIKLGESVVIAPENSPRHLNQCLRELARYNA